MPKTIEKILLILSDFLMINLSFFVWCLIRQQVGSFGKGSFFISVIIFGYWFLLCFFFGLYRSWYAQSRFDEFGVVIKTVVIGAVIAFLLTMDISKDLTEAPSVSRLLFFVYPALMIFFISLGRFILRSIQRKLLESGFGRRKTLIVGWNDKARELCDTLNQYKAMGFHIVGFINIEEDRTDERYKEYRVVGLVKDIPKLVTELKVEEILIALKKSSHQKVLAVISQCDDLPVNLKIMPDLYDIVMGYGRTEQLYGAPLIEIMPQMMPAWEQKIKRLIDLAIALVVLIGFFPIWILIAILIKIDSRGPVLFSQKRVGKNGKIIAVYKFRSMIHKAEKLTGPVWAGKKDPRITRVGRVLRKLRLDEIPQFINILYNDMSVVGPRPERPFFVDRLKRQIPLYTRRLRAKPGITGWAQIKGGYDDTFENVKKKLKYDLFYIENMSLRMDLKIILNTVYTMIAGKGQ
jgi:exopolysaccharide biosynthesis polyprenyl glycosylphosphotransferase